MRFGLGPLGLAPPGLMGTAGVAALLDLAERADHLGIDSFWLHERHFSEPGSLPAPFVLAAAIAARTRRVRLGVCATVTLVHPLRTAEDLAVLDVISGGRTIFSPMRGFRAEEFAAFGVTARTKYGRFSAALQTIQTAWRTGNPDASGSAGPGALASLEVPAVEPRPVQAEVPMWLGSFGNKGVDLAADLGLPYFPAPVESFAGIGAKLAQYAARRAGAPSPAERPIIRDVYVGATQRSAAEDVAPSLNALAGLYQRWGVLADGADAVAYARDRVIVGDAAACREQLARYAEEFGVTYVVCRMNLPCLRLEQMIASLERFCETVAPFVRSGAAAADEDRPQHRV